MLSSFLYYLVIYPVSLLPFWILYRISDIFSFVLEHIVQYRKKVIVTNIRNSFPEKAEREINTITHFFYKHFGDLIIESLKGFNLSEKAARKRISYEGVECIEKYFQEGKDVLIVLGHYGNWEMVGAAMPLFLNHKILAIYKPLTNLFFDNKMKETRGQFGCELVAMKETKAKALLDYGKPKALAFAMDQRPFKPERGYWMTFLNQVTGVLFGSEKFAKTFDLPIIFMTITKPKRGYYKVIFKEMFEKPKETSHGEISQIIMKKLEKDIKEKPEFWLWSHKRGKHKRPEGL